jgi:peptidylprolyl isomerase
MTQALPRAGRLFGAAVLAFAVAFAITLAWRAPALAQADRPHILIELEDGVVDIELRPDLAPQHVERILTLVREGFYDGIVFHRVIDGFMAQTGDPEGTGRGGSSLPDLPAEFTTAAHFERGTLGMARAANPDSANSQFFIMFQPAPHLDGQYTIFGTVVSGMEFVDAIKKGNPAMNGMVDGPDRMISVRVAGE